MLFEIVELVILYLFANAIFELMKPKERQNWQSFFAASVSSIATAALIYFCVIRDKIH